MQVQGTYVKPDTGRLMLVLHVRTAGRGRGGVRRACRGRPCFSATTSARVQVAGSPPYDALLVPDAAIGTEQTRKFVLTVNADNTVVSKYVTLGQITKDNLRVLKSGVGADDRIIVNGLMRARPGQKVTPQEEAKPGAAPPQGANPPQKQK